MARRLPHPGRRCLSAFAIGFGGLGFTPGLWEPVKIGEGYDMAAELKPLDPYKSRMNIFSGFGRVFGR